MGIKPHLNQVSLDIVKKLVDENQLAFFDLYGHYLKAA